MFQGLKNLKQFIDLLEEVKTIDADKKGGPDMQQYIVLAGRLARDSHALQQDIAEIEELFGADVDEIKKRFGIEQ